MRPVNWWKNRNTHTQTNIHINTQIHTQIHTNTHKQTHTHAFTYAHTHAYTHRRTYAHTRTNAHTLKYTHGQTNTHTHTHVRTHPHLHKNTNTQTHIQKHKHITVKLLSADQYLDKISVAILYLLVREIREDLQLCEIFRRKVLFFPARHVGSHYSYALFSRQSSFRNSAVQTRWCRTLISHLLTHVVNTCKKCY